MIMRDEDAGVVPVIENEQSQKIVGSSPIATFA